MDLLKATLEEHYGILIQLFLVVVNDVFSQLLLLFIVARTGWCSTSDSSTVFRNRELNDNVEK